MEDKVNYRVTSKADYVMADSDGTIFLCHDQKVLYNRAGLVSKVIVCKTHVLDWHIDEEDDNIVNVRTQYGWVKFHRQDKSGRDIVEALESCVDKEAQDEAIEV